MTTMLELRSITTSVCRSSLGLPEPGTEALHAPVPVPMGWASAFSLGREDIVPQMFEQLVKGLADVEPGSWLTFRHYLARRIERDSDKHAPAARELVARICGPDTTQRIEAEAVARTCLEVRVALWDDILREIRGANYVPLGRGL
jgi:hypothetical protein